MQRPDSAVISSAYVACAGAGVCFLAEELGLENGQNS